MFGRHHIVGAAVGFARDERDLGHGAFGVGIQQFGAVGDDAAVFLRGAGHEAGHIHQRDDGDVEGIAKSHKSGAFDGRVDVEATGQHERLIGDKADAAPLHSRETGHQVLRIAGLQFKKIALVNHLADDLLDVVRRTGVVGDERVQRLLGARKRVIGAAVRRAFAVV